MSKYDVNFKKLALLLLPTFLRRPALCGVLYAAVLPLNYLHTRFMLFRKDTKYRLTHNGQVCYLRGVLNDVFDPFERRITITDDISTPKTSFFYDREEGKSVLMPMRGSGSVVISCRGFGGADNFDFWINIPFVLQRDLNIKRLNAIVNSYKLASKRYQINYI